MNTEKMIVAAARQMSNELESLIHANRMLEKRNEILSNIIDKDANLKLALKSIICEIENELHSENGICIELMGEYIRKVLNLKKLVK